MNIDFLKQLLDTPGPSGFESAPALGSTVWVELPGEEGSHMDAKKES